MKVLFTLVLNILSFLNTFINSQYCPEYKAEHMAWFNDDYKIINYLKIPKTNILLVNTILQSQSDQLNGIFSVVYYLDISLPQNNTIVAIKPDYTIVNMEYVEELNKILISNQYQILLAEPYTLQATNVIYLEAFILLKRVNGTNYIVITQPMCFNFLIDIFTLSIVSSFNGCNYGIYYRQIPYFIKTFTLSNGYVLMSIAEMNGYQTWILNNNTAQVDYYGYLQLNGIKFYIFSQLTPSFYKQGTMIASEFSDIDKHNQYDIFFVTAQPYYINVIQVIIGDTFQFETLLSMTEYQCLNSVYGQLYNDGQTIYLIAVCEDFQIISFNTVTGKTQKIIKINSIPNHINSFEEIQLIGFGDNEKAQVYLYRFNPKTGLFEFFINFTSNKFTEQSLNLSYLSNTQQLWIQYRQHNIYFPIGQCLQDIQTCLSCQMDFYFSASETQQDDNLYGLGTKESPFTSSQSIIQLILKIQKYYYFVNGIQQITANIYIDPKYQITFREELFNFSFSSSININIQSQDVTNQAQIKTSELLHFSSFQSIQLQNLLFNFDLSTDQEGVCGLAFQQINMSVLLSNITNYSQNNAINCYQIYTVNSTIILQDINIQNQNFSNLSQIILVQDTSKIIFNRVSITNCIFSDKFRILKQVNDVQVIINSFIIQQNKCNQSYNQSSQIVGQLFQASQYLADDLHIINNQFCNQLIFSTISSVNQLDFIFSFSNVEMRNNQFYTTASYLFFNAIYYFNLFPMHTFILQNIDIFNNTNYSIQSTNKQSYNTTFFIQLNKLSNITLSNITFKNHFEIALFSASQSQNVNIYNITCSNDKGFQRSYQSGQYAGCVYFSDNSQLDLNLFRAININSSDNSILSSINQESSKNTVINLLNVEVFNSNFIQSLTNTYSNPIFISSPSDSQIKIEKSSFYNNNLIGLINSETQSTTAIQIINPLGSVFLNEIKFNNSNSDSVYNYIYIQSDIAIIQNCTFSKSSYDVSNQKAIFKQQGGCARVKSNNLQILNSQFSQSTSYSGSFVQVDPLSQILKISVNQSSFSEGYSQSDGSCLYVNSQNTKLDFQILNSNFTDIFSFSQDSYTISIQSDQISLISSGNLLISSVIAQNILGMNNNSFINMINSNATIQNLQVSQMQTSKFTNQFDISKNLKDFFSNAIIYTQNSNVSFIQCNFTNLSGNQNSMNPLLIQSSSSLIRLQNSYTFGCIFTQSLINMKYGELIIQNTTFQNIIQIQNQNRIIQSNQQENQKQSSSLIIMSNSSLKIIQNTLFQSIKCLNNCYGSSIYLSYTSFNISNTQFINSQSSFGGAISIYGMNQSDNFLIQSYFNNNNATYNGGAINLNFYQNDVFQMQITETQFLNNKALTGNGGAIYISSQGVNSTQQKILIAQSQIRNNQAMMGGGIYSQGINPQLDSLSSVSHNQASYNGDNQYSYPSELYLTNQNTFNHSFNQEKQIIVLNDFKSGGVLPNFEFQLRDQNQKPYVLFNNEIISAYFQISSLTKQKEFYSIRGNQIIFGQNSIVSYTRSSKYQCTQCKNSSLNIIKLVLIVLWLYFSISITIKNDKRNQLARILVHAFYKNHPYSLKKQQKLIHRNQKFQIYMKILTNYFQIISSASTFNLNVQIGFIQVLQFIGQPIQTQIDYLDCILKNYNHRIPLIYVKLIFSVFSFVAILVFYTNMNQAQRKQHIFSIIRPKEIIESPPFPETNSNYQKNILFKQRDSKQISKESDGVINWMNLNSNMTQTQSPQIQIQSPKQECLSVTDSVFSIQLINEPKSTNQTNQDPTKFKTKLEQFNKNQY
ncbi:hypothetical protein ABPG74_002674 [Tetrahymena malaccensis]